MCCEAVDEGVNPGVEFLWRHVWRERDNERCGSRRFWHGAASWFEPCGSGSCCRGAATRSSPGGTLRAVARLPERLPGGSRANPQTPSGISSHHVHRCRRHLLRFSLTYRRIRSLRCSAVPWLRRPGGRSAHPRSLNWLCPFTLDPGFRVARVSANERAHSYRVGAPHSSTPR